MAATAAAIGGQVASCSVVALGSRPAAAVSRADGFSMRRSALGGLGSPLRLQTSRAASGEILASAFPLNLFSVVPIVSRGVEMGKFEV